MPLSSEQADRLDLVETSLALFVNETHGILPPEDLVDEETGDIAVGALQELMQIVWDVPDIASEFVRKNPHRLDPVDLEVACGWQDSLPGPKAILGFDDMGRALVPVGDAIVAVTGTDEPWSFYLGTKVPTFAFLTLIPFEGVVTFDRLVGSMDQIAFGPGIARMLDEEVADMAGKRIVERADDFIELVRAERERVRERELEELSEQLEHDRIEHGGVERLPQGVHRGKLFGMSEQERREAVDQGLAAWLEQERRDAKPPRVDFHDELKRCANVRKPETSLKGSLNSDNRCVLERDARRFGAKCVSAMKKAELVDIVARGYLERAEHLGDALIDMRDEEYRTLRALLDAPQGSCAFPVKDAHEHRDIFPNPPFTRLFLHKGVFSALIPDEFRELLGALDLLEVDRARERLAQIGHVCEVMAELCGIVSLADVASRCEALYGFSPDEVEVWRAAQNGIAGDPMCPPFDLWYSPDRQADFIIHFQLSDRAIDRMVVNKIADDGLDPWSANEDFGRRVRDEEAKRDAYLDSLLREHDEKDDALGPCPLDPMLADHDAFEWKERLPEVRNLRNWLDGHVPDEADDTTFADYVIERLLMGIGGAGDPRDIIGIADELGLFLLTSDQQALLGRLMAVANALPDWHNNGWAPHIVLEKQVGHRIFLNPDGSAMKVGRYDPFP